MNQPIGVKTRIISVALKRACEIADQGREIGEN
jgi:hypothetical protein